MSDGANPSVGSIRYETLFAKGMSATQKQTVQWVPRSGRVLELGCSGGYISALLRDQKNCDITGVEVDPAAAEEARAKGLRVLCGSLDDEAFLASLDGEYDMVLANDVLEHLANPDRALARAISLLAPGGRIVISTPNVATWNVRAKLFFGGHFRYEEHGIMDRTHIHFFTWETFHEMLERHHLSIDERAYETFEIPLGSHLVYQWPSDVSNWINRQSGALKVAAKIAVSPAQKVATQLQRRLGPYLGRKLPNLCVPHIVVLVSPSSARP